MGEIEPTQGDANITAAIDQLGTPETLEQAIAERNAWFETAAQFSRNEEYYCGLVDQIGQMLGPDAYTADDGTLYSEVVRAKVPDLVQDRLAGEYGRGLEAAAKAVRGVMETWGADETEWHEALFAIDALKEQKS